MIIITKNNTAAAAAAATRRVKFEDGPVLQPPRERLRPRAAARRGARALCEARPAGAAASPIAGRPVRTKLQFDVCQIIIIEYILH